VSTDLSQFSVLRNLDSGFTDFFFFKPFLEREEVLKLHPDLADSDRVAELTSESAREQTAAGLRTLGTNQSTSISELRAR